MIDALISEWGEAARQWTPIALDATIKASIVVVAAAIICRLASRASAATRHFIWLLAIAAISALPLLSRALPRWYVLPAAVRVPAVLALQTQTELSPAISEPHAQPLETHFVMTGSPKTTTAISRSPAPPATLAAYRRSNAFRAANMTAWIFGIWSVGAWVVMLRLVLGVAAIQRTIRRSNPITDSDWSRLLQQCRRDLGVCRNVALHRLDRFGSPAVWSILGSTILLSRDAEDWSVSRRRAVLRHELAHVVRRDCLTHFLARAALAVHWFNPLAWYALRRLNVERECACDDLALGQERQSVGYAEHVLYIASASGMSRGLTVAPAMARQTELEGRIVAILDEHRNRRVMKRATGTFVAAALFFATLPLAAMAFTPPPLQNSKAAADRDQEADPSRVDRLLAMLLQDRSATNRDAADQLRLLGDDHPDVVSVVESLLGRLLIDDAALRKSAAQALGYTRNPRALQPLIDQLADPVVNARASAAGALGRIGDPRAVDPLIALLDDNESLVREWAVRSLGAIGDSRAVARLIRLIFDANTDADLRVWATRSLGSIGDPTAVVALGDLLTDGLGEEREWAALSLGQIGGPRAMQQLRKALSTADAETDLLATIEQSIAAAELVRGSPDEDPWIRIARTYISEYGVNEEKALRLARLSIRERDKVLKTRGLGRKLPLTPEMEVLVESDPVLRFFRQQVESIDAEIKTARAQPKGNKRRHIKSLEARRQQYTELEAGKREELKNNARQREKFRNRKSPTNRRQSVAEKVEQIKQRRLIAGLDKMAARTKSGRDR